MGFSTLASALEFGMTSTCERVVNLFTLIYTLLLQILHPNSLLLPPLLFLELFKILNKVIEMSVVDYPPLADVFLVDRALFELALR